MNREKIRLEMILENDEYKVITPDGKEIDMIISLTPGIIINTIETINEPTHFYKIKGHCCPQISVYCKTGFNVDIPFGPYDKKTGMLIKKENVESFLHDI